MHQFLAQPPTKKNNSRFNYSAVDIVLEAEVELRHQGCTFGFLSVAIDDVSCNSKFVKDFLLRFLKGDIVCIAMTDANRNEKKITLPIFVRW